MDRGGIPTIAELMALLATKAAEVEALAAERDSLARRILKLEEERNHPVKLSITHKWSHA
jgi:cell division protein FtsB